MIINTIQIYRELLVDLVQGVGQINYDALRVCGFYESGLTANIVPALLGSGVQYL